jgi:hypothetical protein
MPAGMRQAGFEDFGCIGDFSDKIKTGFQRKMQ